MIRLWIIVSCLGFCSAVIYHLNDTEYQSLPPLYSLDEYERCLVEEGSIYCAVQLNLYAVSENELMRMITEYSDHTIKHYNYSIVERGVCVTKTCQNYISKLETKEELSSTLEACLNDSLHREYGLSAKVSTLYYCDHHNEPVHIDAWDWTVLALILALGFLNCVGSIYDYYQSKQSNMNNKNENSLLLSFSVMRNWKVLTQNGTSIRKTGGTDLQFVHGLRVVISLCILIMHTLMGFTFGFLKNTHDIEKAYDFRIYQLMLNGLMIVQIYFFISGFLTVYFLQIEEKKRIFTFWDFPKFVMLKLGRLVPALAMTLALATSWTRHVGSGPLWKLYVTDSLVADCRSYWWHHLLFINNYTQNSKFCLLPTWFLAAEMQVFLAAVAVYLVSRRLLPLLLLLSVAAPALHTLLQDLDTMSTIPQTLRTLESRPFWLQHVLGHNNLPCFILGMFTATKLHGWQKNGGNEVNKWHGLVQYLSIGALPMILYSGSVFWVDGARPAILARAAYNSVVRVLMGLAFAAATFAFFKKKSTYIKSVLEWKHWVVLSRLNYCVYLLHIIIIHIWSGARMQLSVFSIPNLVTAYVYVVVATYLISVPVFLLVEAPFTGLFKTLFNRNQIINENRKEKSS